LSARADSYLKIVLFAADLNIKNSYAPLNRLGVVVEEHIELIALYRAAAVKNLNRLSAVVVGDYHFRTKRMFSVRRYEPVSPGYLMPTGCYAIGMIAAAFLAGAIGCNPHPDNLPLLGIVFNPCGNRVITI
jgi:hypothetical protein